MNIPGHFLAESFPKNSPPSLHLFISPLSFCVSHSTTDNNESKFYHLFHPLACSHASIGHISLKHSSSYELQYRIRSWKEVSLEQLNCMQHIDFYGQILFTMSIYTQNSKFLSKWPTSIIDQQSRAYFLVAQNMKQQPCKCKSLLEAARQTVDCFAVRSGYMHKIQFCSQICCALTKHNIVVCGQLRIYEW